jgi:hypothetical protein
MLSKASNVRFVFREVRTMFAYSRKWTLLTAVACPLCAISRLMQCSRALFDQLESKRANAEAPRTRY